MTSKAPNNAAIATRIAELRDRIATAACAADRDPSTVTLMAVTKTVEPERINAAYDCGVRLFGENRVQEFLDKRDAYKYGASETHFIGHLQTNKVKYIIDKVSMIESVSSQKLALEIEKQAKKHDLTMDVLLEVNIAGEPTKSGVLPEDVYALAKTVADCEHVRLRGLMAIPPRENSAYFFAKMQRLYVDILHKNRDNNSMNILSMGMSGDFEEAIRYGSTIVRVGTGIFGKRDYQI